MKKSLHIFHGLSLPTPFLILPILAVLFIYPFHAVLAIVIGVILLISVLSFEGIQIDLEKNQYKKYVHYLILKKGKWHSLEGYTRICILKKKIAHSQASRSMRTNNFTVELTAIYLTDKTHRRKIFLDSKSGHHQAERRAIELAKSLNKLYEVYNPLISEKTKNRRK